MKNRSIRIALATGLAALAASLLPAHTALAQAFPNRPIRFIVPYGPGTSTDLQARFLAQKLSEVVKQSVVIENKPGVNGVVGTHFTLSQPADGYTYVIGGNTSHAANVSLFKSLPYDPVKDFVPVSGISIGGGALVVSPGFPAKTIPELIALARQHPGKYSYGSATAFTRVAIESLMYESGINLLLVPYKGSASLVTEVVSGTIDLAFEPLVTLVPHIRSGKVHALAVSTPKRAPGVEDIPTVAEQGLPNYQFRAWLSVFARTGTPAEIVSQMNQTLVAILRTPQAADFFKQNAYWEPMIMTTEQVSAFLQSEIELWRTAVKRAAIEPQ